MCIVDCIKYPAILAIAIVMQATLSRCALAIAVGVDPVPLTDAPAPAPAFLSPPQSCIPSEEDIEVIAFPLAPLGHPALYRCPRSRSVPMRSKYLFVRCNLPESDFE